MPILIRYLLPFILVFALSSCVTYYQQTAQFHKNYENGSFEAAQKALASDTKGPEGKARLLYYLNMGIVNFKLKNYEKSNEYFEQAYIYGEDYHKNYLNEILAYFTNPLVVAYPGEDFELLLIHYYKALNFIFLNQKEKALVECRRLINKLNEYSERYKSENKYQRDAFIHTLLGIVFEANGEVNDAFIAYRNAVEIYQTDYKELFGIEVPEQLKKDLLRTAYLLGFQDELVKFEEDFGMKFQKEEANTGDLVFLWHNGFGPIKTEWSINFAISRRGSRVFFTNDQLNLNFPFPLELKEDEDGNKFDPLGGLSVVRVAFPKYVERPPYYKSAYLSWENRSQDLYLAEDIQAIARKTLQQRMALELGKALLRLAIKQAEEQILRNKDKDGLATIVSLINAATERADTRAWQTVPHSIYYTRMPLPPGEQAVQLNLQSPQGSRNFDFTFNIARGKTTFQVFHSLETTRGTP